MEKINIAELLKDCPQGMELDCTMYEDCKFLDVEAEGNRYLLRITTPCGIKYLDKYGCYTTSDKAKCVIFPKGKTTWEGFVPPCKFKDGDVISDALATCIFKREGRIKGTVDYYCGIHDDDFCVKDNKRNKDGHYGYIVYYRFATEEEKQKLFKAIKDNGYKWNPETKTLEKFVEHKFKDGDILYAMDEGKEFIFILKHIFLHGRVYCYLSLKGDDLRLQEVWLTDYNPTHRLATEEEKQKLFDAIKSNGYKWNAETKTLEKLIEPKFDITTLKPYQKVLFRQSDDCIWLNSFFGFYDKNAKTHPFICCNGFAFKYCIPYKGNQHLLGTTIDCDEYYKTWE